MAIAIVALKHFFGIRIEYIKELWDVSMRGNRILPFYMTYPMPMAYEDEDVMLRDLEYLQQMYPQDAKKYQKKIVSILDKMDYEGSMIYDDYPDQFMLYKLSRDITEMIRKDEIAEAANTSEAADGVMSPGRNTMEQETDLSPERWKQTGDMVQVLLFYEIYKRRHNSGRGMLKFF
ncbi:MAG: hypothetical protein K2K20_05275 [Lachnospiraceae bacterium]|nr:hypothetical protein [Lachnospiraceae bacterium]